MTNEKEKIEELPEEELNEAVGGFVITPKQLGFVECAADGCTKRFKPINGETLCEECRKKVGSRFI